MATIRMKIEAVIDINNPEVDLAQTIDFILSQHKPERQLQILRTLIGGAHAHLAAITKSEESEDSE